VPSGIFPPQIEFASSKARNKGLLLAIGHSIREDAAQVTARLLGSKTVNTFLELMQSVEGVELGELEPMTTVLVWTTPAHVDGASTGGGPLKTGWIGLGLVMELHVSGTRIVTTPVIAIATERTEMSTVH
jgi:hypothetical protein